MAELRQALSRLDVETPGRGLVEITRPVTEWLSHLAIEDGLLTLYCRHTSASLLIQENADPDVCRDLEGFFARIAPEDRSLYAHNAEGPDDMPAHIRAALTQTQLSIPLQAATPPRNLAGRLSFRASPRAASARDRAASHRGIASCAARKRQSKPVDFDSGFLRLARNGVAASKSGRRAPVSASASALRQAAILA